MGRTDEMENREGCKRVLLIAASILTARKLAQCEAGTQVPATISALADAIGLAQLRARL